MQEPAPDDTGDVTGDREGSEAGGGRSALSKVTPYARRSVQSGTAPVVGGGLNVLRGLRAFRSGRRLRGLTRIALGGLLLAFGLRKRRARGESAGGGASVDVPGEAEGRQEFQGSPDEVAATDAVETDVGRETETGASVAEESVDEADATESPEDEEMDHTETDADEAADVDEADDTDEEAESGADEAETDDEESEEAPDGGVADEEAADGDDAGVADDEGAAAAETADTDDAPSGDAALEEQTYDRIGAAAFDEHGDEVPAPQRAFNHGHLAGKSEAFWGIREADDAVLVSQHFDPIDEGEGLRYVASSEVGEDRLLRIPDTIQDHWDDVAGGGTAVSSGTDLVFATSDGVEGDVLLVVPEQWADELLGEDS